MRMNLAAIAMLAAAPAASWAWGPGSESGSMLEKAAFESRAAGNAGSVEDASVLAAKALEGGFSGAKAQAVYAGDFISNDGLKTMPEMRESRKTRIGSEVPPVAKGVRPTNASHRGFLSGEEASGDLAAIGLLAIMLGAFIVPAAIGFIVANGVALSFGAVPATAKIIGYAGALIGAKMGLDWFKK